MEELKFLTTNKLLKNMKMVSQEKPWMSKGWHTFQILHLIEETCSAIQRTAAQ